MKDKTIEIEHVAKYLSEVINFDKKIYTVHRHSSKSGMNHSISILIVYENRIINLDYYVAILTERKIDQKNRGVKISGCGMDMGFALIDELFYHIKNHVKGAENWQKHVNHIWI